MPHGKIWGGGGSGHLVTVAHELGVEVRPVQRVEREAVFVRLRAAGGGGTWWRGERFAHRIELDGSNNAFAENSHKQWPDNVLFP